MKINGQEAHSRGQEIVYIYGERTRRAVYQIEGEWKFFAKVNGEYIEVYHDTCFFTTTCKERKIANEKAQTNHIAQAMLKSYKNEELLDLYQELVRDVETNYTKNDAEMLVIVRKEIVSRMTGRSAR